MMPAQIGRGMRLSPDTGKQDCRIIDIVDSQERVSSVVSIPTLLGLDPSELSQGDISLDSSIYPYADDTAIFYASNSWKEVTEILNEMLDLTSE